MINEYGDLPWYAVEEEDKIHGAVLDTLRSVMDGATDRLDRWDVNEILMNEARYDSIVGTSNQKPPSGYGRSTAGLMDGRLRYNIIRAIGDALKARIASSRPKIRMKTWGARYDLRELARMHTRMFRGIFAASDFYTTAQQIFTDSYMYGIGYAKPYEVNGRVRIDRVHPRCVYMDEPDYGNPCSWFQVEYVSKYELKEMFPECEEDIGRSSKISGVGPDWSPGGRLQDSEIQNNPRCTVVEAWYVSPSGDGRHVIVTDQCTLVDEDWSSDQPGIVPFRFFEPAKGFIGQSFVDQLKEIQKEINYILVKIQDHMNLGGTLKVFVDASSRIAVDKLNNEHLQIIKYTGMRGMPIQVVQIPAVDRTYFEQIDRLEQKAYNLVGISELFATAEKPAGIESAKAMSQYEDIQSSRFLHIGQKWQMFFNKTAVATLNMLRESGATVKVGERTLKGNDFDLGKNMFEIAPSIVSILPDSPSGVIQAVSDYAQMDPQIAADAVALLEDLDLEAYLERSLAPKLYVSKIVDKMLFDHDPVSPDATINLEFAIKQATFAIQQAKLADDSKAEGVLVQFVVDCKALMEPEAPPPGVGMPGMPVGPDGAPLPPEGMPMMPPGSEMAMPGAPTAPEEMSGMPPDMEGSPPGMTGGEVPLI